MNKIIVTGASGFIGRSLVRTLKKMQYDVIEISTRQCDLSDPASIDYLSQFSADYVYHVAGKVGIPLSFEYPLMFYRANVDTTRHVLEYCRKKQVPMHYVSAYIYGVPASLPIDETVCPRPNNPYAHSKYMAELLCQFYREHFQVPVTISRPFNIYGWDEASTLFISSVYRQLQQEESVTVGDLSPMRDYVYIDDVVDALIAIMQHGINGEVYNIGTGESFSCGQVIQILQSIMRLNKPVIETKSVRVSDIADVRADISKMFNQTGWKPSFSLLQGLSDMVGETYV